MIFHEFIEALARVAEKLSLNPSLKVNTLGDLTERRV
jgi:hypothetical protein